VCNLTEDNNKFLIIIIFVIIEFVLVN